MLCFMLLGQITASNQPSIESDGLVLAITEATIADGQTLTLLSPNETVGAELSWMKGNTIIGKGASLTISDFDKSKAGVYVLIHNTNGKAEIETRFNINHISLGEDIDACQAQVVDFMLPEGPTYKWSTGSDSNSFRITFEESARVSISAITEFGYLIEDEKIINIEAEIEYVDQPSENAFILPFQYRA